MKKSTFDENNIEELLQQMPKITDHQDPNDLFERISSQLDEEQIDEPQPVEFKRKKPSWIVPALASVAAIFIIALVLPSFIFQNQDSTMEESMMNEQATEESLESAELPKMNQGEQGIAGIAGDDSANQEFSIASSFFESRMIQQLPENTELITAAVPDPNIQMVVPLSFIISKSGQSKIDALNDVGEGVRTAEWGLSDYMLDRVTFKESEDKKAIIIDVPADHKFGEGSITETLFIASVKEMLRPLGYEKALFTTAGNQGITLGNYGEIESLSLKDEQYGYFIYQPEMAPTYYVPHSLTGKSFLEVVTEMKNNLDVYNLQASIPEQVIIKDAVKDENKEVLTIHFAEETMLLAQEEYYRMIEALLLTAKDFGFKQVQFENTGLPQIGEYNFENPIDVPIAANPMPFIKEER